MDNLSVKYSKLPQKDDVRLNFDSIFTYGSDSSSLDRTKSIFSYTSELLKDQFVVVDHSASVDANSEFYLCIPTIDTLDKATSGAQGSRVLETLLIVFCYMFAAATFPLSLLFCLRFVKENEKMVVFRLGRLQHPKEPGASLIMPCIDRCHKVDMRTKAFNVPPLQAITRDGGVLEFGVTVFYDVKNAVQAVLGVRDLVPSIRTLAHTIVHREINKTRLADIVGEQKKFCSDYQKELNRTTFAWGVEIKDIELLNIKVIKKANPPFAGVFSSLFGGGASSQMSTADMPDFFKSTFPQALPGQANVSFANEDSSAFAVDSANCVRLNCDTIVSLLQPVLNKALVESVDAIFQLNIKDMGALFLDLKNGSGHISTGAIENADVVIGISANDCWQIITGELTAFEAYMTGRIEVNGNLKVAMKLQNLKEAWSSYLRTVAATNNSAALA